MTNQLVLLRDGVDVDARVLGESSLEVGSAASCDFVVPDLVARAYLVQARGGTVWLYDLRAASREPRVFALDRPLALGSHHQLVRRVGAFAPERPRASDACTQSIAPPHARIVARWSIVVGRGTDARRVTIADRPFHVGTDRVNDLVLSDPTVSAQHCRLEVVGGALVVRDLDSTNGTYVHGLRVGRALLSGGTQLRIGRTDLHVVARNIDEPAFGDGEPQLVAASASMQSVVAEARRYAQLPWPLLVLGPSGVGKEEVAGLVHREGQRKRAPLVALNAGGLPRELVESELFGHERGAFTGAHGQRRGVFEQAHGGTLFLDEIGELPLSLQSRLLRVLETWKIRRVGGESDIAVDVRLVCATHRDLAQMVHEGTFREDLYYRLARLVLRVPPLRDRPDDIVPLAHHFVRALSGELRGKHLSDAAEARLLMHDWPGNVRELRNVLCAAAVLGATPAIDADDIARALERLSGSLAKAAPDSPSIERVVARYGGNLSAASRALAIPRSTLRDRLRR